MSSTFRDMVAEREELTQKAFPEIRRLCEQRGVTWSEVDLRWGITDEDVTEGRLLSLCLGEIDRCRPFFIGILGSRYGHILPQIPADLLSREPWLASYPHRSVTELEIRHGVLNHRRDHAHALFYVRRAAIHDADEGPEAQRLLAELEREVRASHHPIRAYRDPAQLARLVVEDMTALITRLFPIAPFDPVASEEEAHEAFARVLSSGHVVRKAALAVLERFEGGSGPPLVVTGESGVGKSALLAHWFYQAGRDRTPPETLLGWLPGRRRQGFAARLAHFSAATPDGGSWPSAFRHLIARLNAQTGADEQIPDAPEALVSAFVRALARAASADRVLMVLDGLDDLAADVAGLTWLPERLPEGVRLVVSVRKGPLLSALVDRRWSVHELPSLSPAEVDATSREYLSRLGKRLPAGCRSLVLSSPSARSPLFLRTVLEEIRVFGFHDRLEAQLRDYLGAPDLLAVFGKVVERLEVAHPEPPNLVGDALALIEASRRGLSDSELRDLLGQAGRPMPQLFLSSLRISLRQWLAEANGLLRPSHQGFRQAIRARFAPDRAAADALHRRLADYFESRHGSRRLDELPWQLVASRSWQRLRGVLADPRFIDAAWSHDPFEARAWWRALEAEGHDAREVYAAVIRAPQAFSEAATVALVLRQLGYAAEACRILEALVRHPGSPDVSASLQDDLASLALCYRALGRVAEAESTLRQLASLCRQKGDTRKLQRCLGNLAIVAAERGDLATAIRLHGEEEALCRQLEDEWGLQTSRFNQAKLLLTTERPDPALVLFREYATWARRRGDLGALQAALGNLGVALRLRGLFDDALRAHTEEEELCRSLHDLAGLVGSLGGQADAAMELQDFDTAFRLLEEQRAVSDRLGQPAGRIDCSLRRARFWLNTGFPEDALAAAMQARDLARSHALGEQEQAALRLLERARRAKGGRT